MPRINIYRVPSCPFPGFSVNQDGGHGRDDSKKRKEVERDRTGIWFVEWVGKGTESKIKERRK